MRLYHTSYTSVNKPDIHHSRAFLDFGKGFYLTSIYQQAERYGMRFLRRGSRAWLCTYDFRFKAEEWNILAFYSYNRDWLNFVSQCRAGKDTSNYDMVVGGIANDRVIQTLDRFFLGELSGDETLGLLKYEKPNIQYCIRSQQMIDRCLTFINSIEL